MGWKHLSVTSLLLLSFALASPSLAKNESTIHYDGRCLTINGHDLVIFSGAFHYFRCPKELWADRFEKIKAAHFNTVETYVTWNLCEPQMPTGLNDDSKVDLRDLEAWLKMAEHYGFYIIIRPGPYICAEWDHGGFPGWLITKRPANLPADQVWLRSDDPTYIAWCKHWYKAVCPLLAKHQITRKSPGSPGIILFQLENEYDYSGMSEAVKMSCVKSLAECATANGIDVPFFTCWTHSIRGNSDPVLSKIFDSCNFYPGWNVDHIADDMASLRQAQPNAPLMTTELQGGWFTQTGDEPPLRPDADHYRPDLVPAQIQNLTLFAWQNGDTLTNYYMLFGGTNFADHAAQNVDTTYDYSAPIRENGGVGEKYRVVQALGDIIRQHGPSLARTKLVNVSSDTGFSDVSVADRLAKDGSRYIFIRTNQHESPRKGTASIRETDSGTRFDFDYDLPAFGSKLLYIRPGLADAGQGQWLPRESAPPPHPAELPSAIRITNIHSEPAAVPANWKTFSLGQTLPDLGIYDSRFVYYQATIHLTPDDLEQLPATDAHSIFSDQPSSNSSAFSAQRSALALNIEHASGDHIVALLNGQPIQPMPQTGENYFDIANLLHPGDNHLTLLYENTGFANIGGSLEKRAGVSNIALTILPGNQQTISDWQMHSVHQTDHPEYLEALARNEALDWRSVSTDRLDANQLRPHRWAIFRASVDLSPAEVNGGWTHLHFARIDDEGWIYVNGKMVGLGTRWDQPVDCDARPALRAGRNIIAVIIHNNDGDGGLGPVTWAPDHAQTIGSVSDLRYADQPEAEKSQSKSRIASANVPSLLTVSHLEFKFPKPNHHLWVPWSVHLDASGDGFIYLNGHALGRYWQEGRQRDYFLPECWLHEGGKNEITLRLLPVDRSPAVSNASLIPFNIYAQNR